MTEDGAKPVHSPGENKAKLTLIKQVRCCMLYVRQHEWTYPGWPLEVQERTGEECGLIGVELFTEAEHIGEEKEDVPGDWVLVLDEKEDRGVPKGLESSTDVKQDQHYSTFSLEILAAAFFKQCVQSCSVFMRLLS